MSGVMKDMGICSDRKLHSVMDNYPGAAAAMKALSSVQKPFDKCNEVNYRPAAQQ